MNLISLIFYWYFNFVHFLLSYKSLMTESYVICFNIVAIYETTKKKNAQNNKDKNNVTTGAK